MKEETLGRLTRTRYLKMTSILKCLFVIGFIGGMSFPLAGQRQMENLDRGLVAVKVPEGVFLSWRIPGYEWVGYTYRLYRDGELLTDPPLEISNYVDPGGTLTSRYRVAAVFDGVEKDLSPEVAPWEDQYLEIPLKPRNTDIYEISDVTAADLDGDGQYELIVKRIAQGYSEDDTDYTFFEAYKLDGTFLWEINVGPNIIPEVETNIAAYDLDGDGKAEVFLRTSEGTVFGDGTMIGDTDGDGIINYRYSVGHTAHRTFITEGPEFLSLVDGETGIELDRVDYIPRGDVNDWGDDYGHRASKYFLGAPYLDGVNPSLFIGRGIYTKTIMRTYDVVDKQMVLRWEFHSGDSGPYFGQGNHNFVVADVDGDGRDEIVWGSMTVNDDGSGLYSTEMGHGDAMHVGNMDPFRKGLEAWRCLESSPAWGTVFHDAGTGEILIHNIIGRDAGRAITANISDNITGKALWGMGKMYSASTLQEIGTSGGPVNFRIYWDGDLLEELLDHWQFTRDKGYGTGAIFKYPQDQPVFIAEGAISNRGTKGTPSLQADLFGDWREEVVWRTEDNTAIRIYTTVDPTIYRNYSLMHDHQYRQAIVWQMNAYNQPPHVSYFLGEAEGKTVPPPPVITNNRLVYTGEGDWNMDATIWNKNGLAKAFEANDHVHFDISGGDEVVLSLTTEVAPLALTMNSPGNYTLDASTGKLTGNMTLIKQGAGTFSLNGIHDFTGPVEVWDGLLDFDGELHGSPVLLEFFGEMAASGKILSEVSMRYGSLLYVGGLERFGNLEIGGHLEMEDAAILVFELSGPDSSDNDMLLVAGDMNMTDQSMIRIVQKAEEGLAPGEYVLAQVSGDMNFNPEKIKVEGVLGVPYSLKKIDDQLIFEVREVRSASDVIWNGGNGDIWDLALSENFLLNGEAGYFVSDDFVSFTDAALSKTVNISGLVAPSGVLIDASDDYLMQGDGSISGSTGLIKQGSGRLTIHNTNDFTGEVVISEGIVEVSKMPTNLGPGGIGVVSEEPADLVINGGALRITGDGYAHRAVRMGELGGELDVTGHLYWHCPITGGTLFKSGLGNLELIGVNTHQTTIIEQGVVTLHNEETNPGRTVIFKGGTLQCYDNRFTYSTWDWNFEVPESNSGTINMDSRGYYTGSLTGSGVLNVNLPFIRTDFRGNWSSFSGTINFNSMSGAVDCRFDNSHGLPNATVHVGADVHAYHLRNHTVRMGALEGEGVLSGNHGWVIGANNRSSVFNGSITGGHLVKEGTGTLTLASASTYPGETEINGGRLIVTNNSESATGSGAVTVKTGARLSGTGMVNGPVTVETGARLFAGNQLVGESLTVNGDVTLGSGSEFVVRIRPSTLENDTLRCGGTFTANGTLVMSRAPGTFEAGQAYKIIEAGNISGQFESIHPGVPAQGLKWDTSELYSQGVLKVDVESSLVTDDLVAALKLFPNPAKGELIISHPFAGEVIYTLENANGQTLLKGTSKGGAEIILSLSGIDAGLCVVRLRSEGRMLVGKVMVK